MAQVGFGIAIRKRQRVGNMSSKTRVLVALVGVTLMAVCALAAVSRYEGAAVRVAASAVWGS